MTRDRTYVDRRLEELRGTAEEYGHRALRPGVTKRRRTIGRDWMERHGARVRAMGTRSAL